MFFFFSSRRRHTRCSRDWSSDVCSSDLVAVRGLRHLLCGALDAEVSRRLRFSRGDGGDPAGRALERSEEHTSELQSRLHLVCRLLLEKKKKKHDSIAYWH